MLLAVFENYKMSNFMPKENFVFRSVFMPRFHIIIVVIHCENCGLYELQAYSITFPYMLFVCFRGVTTHCGCNFTAR
jgi:hypothetical protein